MLGRPHENKNEELSDDSDSGDMGRLKNTSENSSDEDSNLELKQSFPGAFVLYKKEKIAEMKRITPAHKIGKDFSVDDWNRLTDNKKKVYHDRAAAEKLKKEAKRLANRKHKDMKKGEKSAKEETEKVCEIRYAEVIEKRVKKMEVLEAQQEGLKEALSSVEVETSIVMKLSKEKDMMTLSVKEKYVKLFKMHKTCEKKLK